MDPFHERPARVALEVASSYGFALAGGYAIQAHGCLDRPSADMDLFAKASAEFDFAQAVRQAGLATGWRERQAKVRA